MDADCGLLLRELRCCVCVCIVALSCVKGRKAGGKDQWRGVRMHSRRAPSSITPRSRPLLCVSTYACTRAGRRVFETGKIESAEALPYHHFAVPLFPFQRVCVSSLYTRCFSSSITETLYIYCPQRVKVKLRSVWSLWSHHV